MIHTTLKRVTAILCSLPKKNLYSRSLKKPIYAAVFFLSIIHTLHAQQPALKPLSIGDTVPDITLTNVYNYPSSTIKISDLKGKLVILDFMTSGCISCIEALPRFDSLQRKYHDQLQIFLVTPESEKSVKNFLKRKYMAKIQLPVIATDTLFSKIFPHTFIPHEVLIKDQRVAAITFPEYIVDKNISAVINNNFVDLPVKRDITEFQYSEPLLQLNKTIIPHFSYPSKVFYSTVAGNMENVPPRFVRVTDSATRSVRITMINFPVLSLYLRTFSLTRLAPAFIILKNSNKGRYIYDEQQGYYNQWQAQNTYCYQGVFPSNIADSTIWSKIRHDLDFYLGLKGKLLKRNQPCWVICKIPGGSIKKNEPVNNGDPESNASVDDILYFLNKSIGNTPAFNESGEDEKRLAGLTWRQCTDIVALKKILPNYGLQINLETRPVELLQISEEPSTKFQN